MAQEAIRDKLNEKLRDGKVEVAQSKAEREAAAMVQIGGGKKQKGRRKNKEVVEYEDSFNIDFVIIQKFAKLGITAPVNADDIDSRL